MARREGGDGARLVRVGRRGAAPGRRRLPAGAYAALVAGSEQGLTASDDVAAFAELVMARAAAARGIAMGLSCFASRPIEDVVTASPKTQFQVHWTGALDDLLALLDRADRPARSA